MTTYLSFSLLGPFEAYSEDGQSVRFRSDMERAVFAYILEESKASYHRASLAELCWPDKTSKKSHNNLRQVLFGIRKAFREVEIGIDIFITGDHTDVIKINPNIEVNLDTKIFRRCFLDSQKQQSKNSEISPVYAKCLTTAVDIYRGEFLEGNNIFNKTIEFYNWVSQTRRFYLRKTTKALDQLANYYENLENYDLAYDYVTRQLHLDPLKESAHLQMIRILARDGRRSAALEQYENCRYLLDQSLGIEPNAKIKALHQQICNGTFP